MPFLFATGNTWLTDILLNISHTWRFDCLCSSLESFVDNLVSFPTKWSLSFLLYRPQQGSCILASSNWEIYRIYVLGSGDTDERLPWPILFTFTARRKPHSANLTYTQFLEKREIVDGKKTWAEDLPRWERLAQGCPSIMGSTQTRARQV